MAYVAGALWHRRGFDFFVPWFNGQGGFTMSADGETYTLDVSLCEEALDTDPVTKVQACVPGRERPQNCQLGIPLGIPKALSTLKIPLR